MAARCGAGSRPMGDMCSGNAEFKFADVFYPLLHHVTGSQEFLAGHTYTRGRAGQNDVAWLQGDA